MNVAPLTIETIIRSSRRDRPLLLGWLLESLVETARKLWPEFAPFQPTRRAPSRIVVEQEAAPEPRSQRTPRWLRRLVDPDETSQALVEYAVILALVAVIAIIALVFFGQQVASTLSAIGNSIGDTAP